MCLASGDPRRRAGGPCWAPPEIEIVLDRMAFKMRWNAGRYRRSTQARDR